MEDPPPSSPGAGDEDCGDGGGEKCSPSSETNSNLLRRFDASRMEVGMVVNGVSASSVFLRN